MELASWSEWYEDWLMGEHGEDLEKHVVVVNTQSTLAAVSMIASQRASLGFAVPPCPSLTLSCLILSTTLL